MVAVLGVETRIVDQIDATTNNITGGKGGPVRLPIAGRAERVTVVTVVAVRLLVPPGQTIHLEVGMGQPDAHVAVPAFRDDFHLEVVQSAGGRYRISGTHRGSICV